MNEGTFFTLFRWLMPLLALLGPSVWGDEARFWLARPGDSYARIASRLQLSTQDVAELNGGKPVLQGAPIRLPEVTQITPRKGETWEMLADALRVPVAALKAANPQTENPVAGRPLALPGPTGPMPALQWPVSGKIRDSFGSVESIAHYGMTFSLGRRSVQAAAQGTVSFAGPLRGLGPTIMVSHSGRLITLYAGVDKITKKVGDPVKRGEGLGQVEGDFFFSIFQEGFPQDPSRLVGAAKP